MGGRLSRTNKRIPFSSTEKHYKDGMSNPDNLDIDRIYLALIMRLNYSRRKNEGESSHMSIKESISSNSVVLNTHIPFVIPATLDFLSGYTIWNNHPTNSCTVMIRCGTTVFESIHVPSNKTVEINTPALYLLMVAPTRSSRWNIYTEDHDGIEISCKCGIIHNSVINLYIGCIKEYISTSGSKVSYSVVF